MTAPPPTTAAARLRQKQNAGVRAKRIRPHLDDKILASWNGLMLGAFARASAVLGDEKYRAAAEKNLAFIRKNCGTKNPKPLFHRWRDGERDTCNCSKATRFLLSGVIDFMKRRWNRGIWILPIALAEAMLAKFYDAENGGFWQSAAEAKDLILRVKDDYDGAEPSGNSVATLALLKLAAITGRENFTEAAERHCACSRTACKISRRPCRSCCTRWIFHWRSQTAS
jgi:uncharacterized protein